jgi:hypothetical protein
MHDVLLGMVIPVLNVQLVSSYRLGSTAITA